MDNLELKENATLTLRDNCYNRENPFFLIPQYRRATAMPFKKGQSGNPGGKWKPGQSGNPGGRPKTKKFREAIERQLALRATKDNPDQGYDDMAAAMIARIDAHGDVSAWKELRDTIDGKVPTPIGGTDELPAIQGFSWIEPVADEPVITDNAELEGEEETKH